MERDINRQQADSLVRQLTEERERFVSAWQQGAGTPELNQIRKNIQRLNDLLWDSGRNTISGSLKTASESSRDFQNRHGGPGNNHP